MAEMRGRQRPPAFTLPSFPPANSKFEFIQV